MTMEEYISTHCVVGTDKVGSQLPIRVIENLGLNIVVLVLTQISWSTALHKESRPLMFYACDIPTINLCQVTLPNQLYLFFSALIPICDIPDLKPTGQAMPPNKFHALIPYIFIFISI
jgi:hypothetical protein